MLGLTLFFALSDVILERPTALWLGVLLIPLIIWAIKKWQDQAKLKEVLGSSFTPISPLSLFIRLLTPLLVFVFIVFTWAGPKGNPHYSEQALQSEQKVLVSQKQGNWLLVLDTSASMKAVDTPSGESRFDKAKELADLLLSQSDSSNVSLWAMGSEMVEIVPRTQDKVFTRLMLKELQINDGGAGTAFQAAFQELGTEIKEAPDPVLIILFSDGDDTALEGKKGEEKNLYAAQTLKTLLPENRPGVAIYTVAMGTKEGAEVPGVVYKGASVMSKRNASFLEYLSFQTLGKSYIYNDQEASKMVAALTADLNSRAIEILSESYQKSHTRLLWTLYYQLPLLMAIIALILFLTWPDTLIKKMLTFLVIGPFTLQGAPTLQDRQLERQVQIGMEAGQYKEVEELLETILQDKSSLSWLRGAAFFNKALLSLNKGDYEKARDVLSEGQFLPNSSFWALEKFDQLYARLEYLEAKEKEKQKKSAASLLFLALLTLRQAKMEACAFEKEKGYKNCPPIYEIEQVENKIKISFLKGEPSTQKKLSEILKWEDRVRLTEAYVSYYEAFKKDVDSKFKGFMKEALTSYSQKDFAKSLVFLNKEKEKVLEELAQEPLIDRLQALLDSGFFSLYDIQAIQDKGSEQALVQMKKGDLLGARLFLINRLQILKRQAYQVTTPIQVLENGLDDMEAASLLRLMSEKKVLTTTEAEGSAIYKLAHQAALETIAPFISVSEKWRTTEFLEKGCEKASWNLVIPHFQKGLTAAEDHEERLAIKEWKEALKILKNPPPPSSESPQAARSLSQTVQLMQDLEIDDKNLKMPTITPIAVEKPW